MTDKNDTATAKIKNDKIHPWRLCSAGEHWVRTYNLHIPSSKTYPEGYETIRHGHCAKNSSGKDVLFPDEIKEVGDRNFTNVNPKPCSLELGFENGNKYDDLIAGWTKYWNDIFTLTNPLDPNLVKALIATESSFNPKVLANKKDPKSGRGLMQILDSSRKILGNEKGELKNHFVHVTRENLNDPNINICTGIRWLFHKQKLASCKLKHEANWKETIYEFKGLSTTTEKKAENLLNKFNDILEKYKKCEKK